MPNLLAPSSIVRTTASLDTGLPCTSGKSGKSGSDLNLSGNITLDDYIAFLQQAYHHVKHTVPLLMAVGSKLPEDKEWLREAVAEYIEKMKRGGTRLRISIQDDTEHDDDEFEEL